LPSLSNIKDLTNPYLILRIIPSIIASELGFALAQGSLFGFRDICRRDQSNLEDVALSLDEGYLNSKSLAALTIKKTPF